MSERSINKLLSGKFFVSEGRDVLKDTVMEGILKKPLLGYGIAGDRTLIGIYVHNIVLELLVSYGIPVGICLTGVIGFLIWRGYCRADTDQGKNLILLLACAVMIKLMMSGTYLQEELFFLLLGACVGQMRGDGGPAPELVPKEIQHENL